MKRCGLTSPEHPESPVAKTWDLVVLDEAQKIKNPGTALSWTCKKLRRRRQWALTGTPLENCVDDLVSILTFVQPDSLPRGGAFNHWQTRELLSQVQLRRRKVDVLPELPPKLFSHVVLPLTRAQRVNYDRAELEGVVELRALGESIQVTNVLGLIHRLKQICNFCPATGQSSKMDDLRDRVEWLSSQGHKGLVFSQFTNTEYGARRIAGELGDRVPVYAGDLSDAQRQIVLTDFRAQPDIPALVLSIRAGGQGLNLQEASYVFHFDRWWNPSLERQAEARSHRIGQRSAVNVYTYTCENTIEERIEQILASKQLLFDELVDGVSLDLSRSLTPEELFGLFGLKPPIRLARWWRSKFTGAALGRNKVWPIARLWAPLKRMTPMPASPWAVAMAAMVS